MPGLKPLDNKRKAGLVSMLSTTDVPCHLKMFNTRFTTVKCLKYIINTIVHVYPSVIFMS